ncbi:terminase large subunit [Microcystis phage vB_MweS-yong2]|nr:terminase large subunit [Microcystis phage vB_MweS-yong2]
MDLRDLDRVAPHPGALRLAASELAAALRPPPPMRVSEWAAQNIVLVDGPAASQLWSPRGAPYLVEILDCLSEDHPANLITVRKSQQTGASIAALAWVLYCADREPANMLYAVPGIDALKDTNSGKLQPLIDAWQRRTGRRAVIPQTSRSGTGSTTYEKVFARGGRLWLGNANSVMDLSSKTAKKGVKDELSKWQPIPGAQDPEDLYFGRFTAFRASADWKILEISTPEIDSGDANGDDPSHCRIDRSFRRSDQRFWHIACPECGTIQAQRFERLKVDVAAPHRSAYECEGCGHLVTEAERRLALQPENGARWIATAAGPDRHPGFHISAFESLMMSYEAIAEDWLKQRGSELGQKGFHNLVLGLPFAFKGDAPDHKLLMDRREEHLQRGHVPPDALLLTAAADVQMRGVWFEVVAWTRDRVSCTVDAGYLGGDTDAPDSPVFERLRREVLEREFPDAYGRTLKVDALAIDSGYRANVVYAWSRAMQRAHPITGRDVVLAVKGVEGWGTPAMGQPSLRDIDLAGRKVRQGARVWPVGTWPLKSSVYLDLGKSRGADMAVPPGCCRFGGWQDEEYFRQLTAEHLEDITVRGRPAGKRWVRRGENHFLDCRVYNMALAEYLGLSSMTENDWAALARLRGRPAEADEPTLFSQRPGAADPNPEQNAQASPARLDPSQDWLGGRGERW